MPTSRRGFIAGAGVVVLGTLGGIRRATAQTASPPPSDAAIEDLVAASRILANEGVMDGYGHVSIRHPGAANRFLMSRSLAPALVTAADIMEYDLDSTPVDPRGRTSFLERFIHGEIYKAQPAVMAVVHNHSPSVIPFGVSTVPLRPLYHMSAFLGGGVPVFDIRTAAGGATDMLISTPALGHALAQTLGTHSVALMRGHGAVVVAPTLPLAVFRSIYTEINARLQGQALALGGPVTYLDAEEARKAESTVASTIGRAWQLWKTKAMAR